MRHKGHKGHPCPSLLSVAHKITQQSNYDET
jgi:hypothetical protein